MLRRRTGGRANGRCGPNLAHPQPVGEVSQRSLAALRTSASRFQASPHLQIVSLRRISRKALVHRNALGALPCSEGSHSCSAPPWQLLPASPAAGWGIAPSLPQLAGAQRCSETHSGTTQASGVHSPCPSAFSNKAAQASINRTFWGHRAA